MLPRARKIARLPKYANIAFVPAILVGICLTAFAMYAALAGNAVSERSAQTVGRRHSNEPLTIQRSVVQNARAVTGAVSPYAPASRHSSFRYSLCSIENSRRGKTGMRVTANAVDKAIYWHSLDRKPRPVSVDPLYQPQRLPAGQPPRAAVKWSTTGKNRACSPTPKRQILREVQQSSESIPPPRQWVWSPKDTAVSLKRPSR